MLTLAGPGPGKSREGIWCLCKGDEGAHVDMLPRVGKTDTALMELTLGIEFEESFMEIKAYGAEACPSAELVSLFDEFLIDILPRAAGAVSGKTMTGRERPGQRHSLETCNTRWRQFDFTTRPKLHTYPQSKASVGPVTRCLRADRISAMGLCRGSRAGRTSIKTAKERNGNLGCNCQHIVRLHSHKVFNVGSFVQNAFTAPIEAMDQLNTLLSSARLTPNVGKATPRY